jgi:uncharacterized protein YqeY
MTITENLKQQCLQLRKERSPVAASIQFALSEIAKVGKNAGNRAATEDEAIRVIQKLIATVDENLKLADNQRQIHLNQEKTILSSVLPQMVSDTEIVTFLKDRYVFAQAAGDMPSKGEIMKSVKQQFGARVDMKRVGELVNELYAI